MNRILATVFGTLLLVTPSLAHASKSWDLGHYFVMNVPDSCQQTSKLTIECKQDSVTVASFSWFPVVEVDPKFTQEALGKVGPEQRLEIKEAMTKRMVDYAGVVGLKTDSPVKADIHQFGQLLAVVGMLVSDKDNKEHKEYLLTKIQIWYEGVATEINALVELNENNVHVLDKNLESLRLYGDNK